LDYRVGRNDRSAGRGAGPGGRGSPGSGSRTSGRCGSPWGIARSPSSPCAGGGGGAVGPGRTLGFLSSTGDSVRRRIQRAPLSRSRV